MTVHDCSLLIKGDPLKPIYNESKTIVVKLKENQQLNAMCSLKIPFDYFLYAYITKNLSASIADLKNDTGHKAICTYTDGTCSIQFNRNVSNITGYRYRDMSCQHRMQGITFKKDVTLKEDNGTKILCAFKLNQTMQLYTSIYLNVVSIGTNHPSSQTSLGMYSWCYEKR